MKKYISEGIGTFVLVFIGCGTAMMLGCSSEMGCGYLLTALAFGLSVTAMIYCLGNISGGHFNTAVTLAMLLRRSISKKDAIMYWLYQLAGGFFAAWLLSIIFTAGGVPDTTYTFASNGLDGVNGNYLDALLIEIILTFIFVLTILGVTSEKFKHGSLGGLIIGLALTLVHIFGIGLTGTGVNPCRSIGPAVIAAASGNTIPLTALWVFILAPLAGGALAAIIYSLLEKE